MSLFPQDGLLMDLVLKAVLCAVHPIRLHPDICRLPRGVAGDIELSPGYTQCYERPLAGAAGAPCRPLRSVSPSDICQSSLMTPKELDRLKIFIPTSGLCTILILGLWLPSRNAASITAFAALYGLCSGALRRLRASLCVTDSSHPGKAPSSPCWLPTLRASPHAKSTAPVLVSH